MQTNGHNSAQGLLERSWITGVLPSEIIASYMMSQFLVMVMQVTITLHCKPVDSYNNDNIGQAAITLITVFVVFQIPCQGPIAWLVVLTLLQGEKKYNMFFCSTRLKRPYRAVQP